MPQAVGLLVWFSRPSEPTHDGPPYPSLRVQLIKYPCYQTSSGGSSSGIKQQDSMCYVSQVLFQDRVVLMLDQMSIKNDFTNWYWQIALHKLVLANNNVPVA
jgi:hypothetical protein